MSTKASFYIAEFWTGSEEEKEDYTVDTFDTVEECIAFEDGLTGDAHVQFTEYFGTVEHFEDDPCNWVEWTAEGLLGKECVAARELAL